MASLNADFFIKNKDKWGSWNIAWIMGSTPDQPLLKTWEDAVFGFLETGSLDYLPRSSDMVLNVLTNGREDFEDLPMRIPEKCEYNSIHIYIWCISDFFFDRGGPITNQPSPTSSRKVSGYQEQPEPAPVKAPIEASMGPPAQGHHGPISISNLLNLAPNPAPNPVKGKSKASEKGRKSM